MEEREYLVLFTVTLQQRMRVMAVDEKDAIRQVCGEWGDDIEIQLVQDRTVMGYKPSERTQEG